MKVVSIVGARPQFIKAAPVSQELRRAGYREVLIHTGQHYDYELSQVFFEELDIPTPDRNLEVGSASHGVQTARILEGIEDVLVGETPDVVLIYGDTNSTLAAALAACKLGVPIAHVEAGLRSFNRSMPEEHNRVLADHCADILFCPTETAMTNLRREGIGRGAHLVGDTMYDMLRQSLGAALERPIRGRLGLEDNAYLLATIHRPGNTDRPEHLRAIATAFERIELPVILPLHPRTRGRIDESDVFGGWPPNVTVIDPVGYLDMLALQAGARMILTDSGGIQKEALLLKTPCITMRPETEWVETVACGWNVVTDADADRITAAVRTREWPQSMPPSLFGHGDAAVRIVEILTERFASASVAGRPMRQGAAVTADARG